MTAANYKSQARSWDPTETLARLAERMSPYSDRNTAPVPLALTQELREEVDRKTGESSFRKLWTVDLHVRIPRVAEFDINTEGDTLADALRRCYIGLNGEDTVILDHDKTLEKLGLAA